jgi:hypothetical protein
MRNPLNLTPPPRMPHDGPVGTNRALPKKPTLTAATVVMYLDWLAEHIAAGHMLAHQSASLISVAELVIRTTAVEAQGKATQHTLVEDGVIAPPPVAS